MWRTLHNVHLMKSITFRDISCLTQFTASLRTNPSVFSENSFWSCIFLLENKNGNGMMAYQFDRELYLLPGRIRSFWYLMWRKVKKNWWRILFVKMLNCFVKFDLRVRIISMMIIMMLLTMIVMMMMMIIMWWWWRG